ncbi:competence/damage-inducible protein A [Methylicorpusculum sp.]|uniref:competence/damage-inducible protein A n=1 Tax=Methylicorpusculum sp. TaxID=2713644 RepID=UPI002725A772|nr:molybdopterin-binding protein [Methylicorpusculum sp.]MDO8845537.1 molybdopterin-binding protein [Methylicorpusculum sp.]MDP2179294.1 molybdopterin-binding protein [Methylicorpusculum sp.]MDP3530076.1 molybdopterin-binding protein [Methylicorpusculum sp.]MDZ4154788.1 molybdopterin-binding protein [Methylicorpusculum sp.]
MNPKLELFSQGEEVVTGQTVDTNAAWLAQACVNLGFMITRQTAVGDKLEDLVTLLNEIAERSDCCICTGGLGPTSDDLTAQAVAQAFSLPLEFDPVAFEQIERFFLKRKRAMPEVNRKQAYLPKGAQRIDNEWGTAPGFTMRYNDCWFVFLPGVPSEMRQLFDSFVRDHLGKQFSLKPKQLVSLKTVGIGESDIQTAVASIKIPETVQLGFRAGVDHVETKLLFPHDYDQVLMTELIDAFAANIGDFVFSIDRPGHASGDLVNVVDRLMQVQKQKAVFIETLSQGLLSAKCVDCDWLIEGAYYSDIQQLAEDFDLALNDKDLLAVAIAEKIKHQKKVDLVLVQLHLSDRNTIRDKNIAVEISTALLTPHGMLQVKHMISGPAQRKQNQSAVLALDTLRRYLQLHQ